jgi:hypothetical protein
LGCVLFIVIMCIFLLLDEYGVKCHSFVIPVYLKCTRICGLVQVCLVIGPSFQYAARPVFGRLCYMCVLCQVCVERILSFVLIQEFLLHWGSLFLII